MSDLISRADAIEALYEKGESLTAWGKPLALTWEQMQEVLSALPSAEAVHGEWRIGNTYRDRISRRLITRLECSNCDAIGHRLVGEQFPNFCQNCGARMKGGDSE